VYPIEIPSRDLQIENVKKYLVEKEERENLLRQKERERIISGLKALSSVWDKHRSEDIRPALISEGSFKCSQSERFV